jgi:hypothetical protein
MIFKNFRDNIVTHLHNLIQHGKPLEFTHRRFFGWTFKVVAVKEDIES